MGIVEDDVASFLDSCEQDGVEVLGWQLWFVEVPVELEGSGKEASARVWGSLSPWLRTGGDTPMLYGGSGDLHRTRSEIASLRLVNEILPHRLSQIRFNFTLAV